MEEPAFLSEELDLDDNDRIGAAHTAMTTGTPSKNALLELIRKEGQIEGVLEAALLLPLRDYRDVEEVWNAAPKPKLPKIRRRK